MDSPQQEYDHRLRLREAESVRLGRRDRWLGNARVALVSLVLVLVWPTLIRQVWPSWWLIVPLAGFVALLPWHGLVAARLGRLGLGVAFYRRGLRRLAGDWSEPLDDGAGWRDERHPYAADLDLFGPGSLYALLSTAHSLPGRGLLAEWLSSPALPAEIGARQLGVKELSGRLALQEELAVLAAGLSPEISVARLDEWGGSGPQPEGASLPSGLAIPILAAVLGVVNLVTVSFWLFGPLAGRMVLPALAASGLLALVLRSRTTPVLAGLFAPAGELRFFARALNRLEREEFTSSRLVELQRRAIQAADRPSARLLELARLIEWNDSRDNLLFRPIAALLLLGTQFAFAVERWRSRHGAAVGDWLRAIGEFETLSALATFSYENPDYVFPEIVAGPPLLAADDLTHPLLPRASRVANSLQLGGGEGATELRLLLVSGSNMSGKSTLLRTAGVAAVLALAGAPVAARRLRLSPLVVGASIRVNDSLLDGVSRFYAELQRLRQIRDLAASGRALFLLDEILHGTNSHDRRLGAAGVIRGLLDAGGIGLVTTHDLALAEIAEELAPLAANVHFEDHLEAGRMAFDYRLHPGAVEQGNALALMRSLGLPVGEE